MCRDETKVEKRSVMIQQVWSLQFKTPTPFLNIRIALKFQRDLAASLTVPSIYVSVRICYTVLRVASYLKALFISELDIKPYSKKSFSFRFVLSCYPRGICTASGIGRSGWPPVYHLIRKFTSFLKP